VQGIEWHRETANCASPVRGHNQCVCLWFHEALVVFNTRIKLFSLTAAFYPGGGNINVYRRLDRELWSETQAHSLRNSSSRVNPNFHRF
jgi:hypothetical protein